MNLANLLAQLGFGDGQGNTSIMRLLVAGIVASVLVPAVYVAVATKTHLVLTSQDLALIGIALGAKCVQNPACEPFFCTSTSISTSSPIQ